MREISFTSNNKHGGVKKMDKKNTDLPDFNTLNDRVIAEPSSSPSLVIKTNLDSEDIDKDNPYAKGESSTDFKNFFKD